MQTIFGHDQNLNRPHEKREESSGYKETQGHTRIEIYTRTPGQLWILTRQSKTRARTSKDAFSLPLAGLKTSGRKATHNHLLGPSDLTSSFQPKYQQLFAVCFQGERRSPVPYPWNRTENGRGLNQHNFQLQLDRNITSGDRLLGPLMALFRGCFAISAPAMILARLDMLCAKVTELLGDLAVHDS